LAQSFTVFVAKDPMGLTVAQYTNLIKTAHLSNPLQMIQTLTPHPAISEAESEITALT
jgi:hypothetical protein